MNAKEQKKAAKEFAMRWQGKGYEKGQSQRYWIDLLTNVLGVEDITDFISFEDKVMLDHTSFIDAFIPSTHVLIEQKSIDKDLRKGIKQSDGTILSPFQQAKRYSAELSYSQRPRWIVTCNFAEFDVYDMEKPNAEPERINLKDLEKEYYRLQFLIDIENENLKKEMELSLKAGDIVGLLYDTILKQYNDPADPENLKSLNKLCVRLVFCLYAEDAGIFGKHQMFHDYMKRFSARDFRKALIDLFKVLDTKQDERDEYLDDDLAAFPYVNGGLFNGEITIPRFTDEIINILLFNASEDFDWSEISPTIFGAVFESTLNPETRHNGGMHYTSIENIHKVIDPLFLDEIKAEFNEVKDVKRSKDGISRKKIIDNFHQKLGTLTFLDPACGSGNFLTETYLSLRKIENELIIIEQDFILGQGLLTMDYSPIRISISQFYGIEINDFAVSVAKTALWIAELQMMQKTQELLPNYQFQFLPLCENANIKEDNALRIDWESVIQKEKLSYIMGNPPFVGARRMSELQKDDVFFIFDGVKNKGNLDYVSCWYKKATDFMKGTSIRSALVSTNSITQGEQVSILWKNLFEQGIHIDFAYRTFRWDSEASIKAHVHCVIVGFSLAPNTAQKHLFDNGADKIVKNINGYLVEADDIVIESNNKPLCNVPEIGIGNQPIDDGNYLFSEKEMEEFIKVEPLSENYFHPWIGADEFINGYYRYCLWLGECSPKELRSMPKCLERVENVRKFRLSSKRKSTLKLADSPTRFQTENMPSNNYIVIPEISSEKRKYIPIGFLPPQIMCSNRVKISQNATLYHFGVLTSNVHMAWTRAFAGRLESRYCYSINIVYNNFPWCNPTNEQITAIERTAQMILDARALYPDSSLADLYDDLTMPSELRKAHQLNDKAVMNAYGFSTKITESECVAELIKLYQKLTK